MENKKQGYTYLIEVKCKAPKGYKPRTMTYKGVGFAKNQKSHAKLEQIAVARIKTELEEQNKGLTIDVQAKASLYLISFVVDAEDIETLNIKLF